MLFALHRRFSQSKSYGFCMMLLIARVFVCVDLDVDVFASTLDNQFVVIFGNFLFGRIFMIGFSNDANQMQLTLWISATDWKLKFFNEKEQNEVHGKFTKQTNSFIVVTWYVFLLLLFLHIYFLLFTIILVYTEKWLHIVHHHQCGWFYTAKSTPSTQATKWNQRSKVISINGVVFRFLLLWMPEHSKSEINFQA